MIKSINELSCENNTLTWLVLSHAIKMCGVQNKIDKGFELMFILYKNNNTIDQNIVVDILMNQMCYFLRTNPSLNIEKHYCVRFFCVSLLITKLFIEFT